MGQVIGQVALTPLDSNGGRDWRILQPFSFIANNGDRVDVTAGDKTDLASDPWWLWWFMPPEGLWTIPAVVHDESYKQQKLTRLRCDQIFLEFMTDKGVDPVRKFDFYWGVRLGGWYAWNQYKQENAARRS